MNGAPYALVLAAGAASRFGGGKLTALWRGEPLVRWSVRAAMATRVEGVVLVTGSGGAEVESAVADLGGPRLTVVKAADWADGLSASIRAGIQALPADATAVAIFLGDMPAVDPALADRLLDAVSAGAPAARPKSPLGPAHPTVFAASAFPALMGLTGDKGGRPVLAALGDGVATVATKDLGAVFDVDRRDDLGKGPLVA